MGPLFSSQEVNPEPGVAFYITGGGTKVDGVSLNLSRKLNFFLA